MFYEFITEQERDLIVSNPKVAELAELATAIHKGTGWLINRIWLNHANAPLMRLCVQNGMCMGIIAREADGTFVYEMPTTLIGYIGSSKPHITSKRIKYLAKKVVNRISGSRHVSDTSAVGFLSWRLRQLVERELDKQYPIEEPDALPNTHIHAALNAALGGSSVLAASAEYLGLHASLTRAKEQHDKYAALLGKRNSLFDQMFLSDRWVVILADNKDVNLPPDYWVCKYKGKDMLEMNAAITAKNFTPVVPLRLYYSYDQMFQNDPALRNELAARLLQDKLYRQKTAPSHESKDPQGYVPYLRHCDLNSESIYYYDYTDRISVMVISA